MAKNLPPSVSEPIGPGDSGINPINIGGNSGLPSSVSSPLASSAGIGATRTDTSKKTPGPGPSTLD